MIYNAETDEPDYRPFPFRMGRQEVDDIVRRHQDKAYQILVTEWTEGPDDPLGCEIVRQICGEEWAADMNRRAAA